MILKQRSVEELVTQLTFKEKISLLAGESIWTTMPIEQLGIPSLVMTDGPHGVRADPYRPDPLRRSGFTMAFPVGIAMAASWDVDLLEKLGIALGEETRAMGCDILLGPCINIMRTPLAGRNFESFSEDPYLAGRVGVA